MRGTQHLTALAEPDELIDWRLALSFETAHASGILDELPATAEQIAASRQLDASAVEAILFVLAAWQHVTVDEHGVFSEGPQRLSPQERAALAQHGTWIRRWAALVPRRVHDRQASAADDPPPPDPATGLAMLESASRPFIDAVVAACLRECRAAEGRSRPRVLDLGGGHGAYSLTFAGLGCDTTMQDLPGVIELARSNSRFTDAGVELVAADAFAHLSPGPFDLTLCATLTNLFPLHRVRALLDELRAVLSPGGQVAIATWLRDRGPIGSAFGVQMLVATPAGAAHSEAEYRQVLAEAGYSDVRFVEVGRPALTVIFARR